MENDPDTSMSLHTILIKSSSESPSITINNIALPTADKYLRIHLDKCLIFHLSRWHYYHKTSLGL